VEILIDRSNLTGNINLVGTPSGDLTPDEATALLGSRTPHPDLQPDPRLPDDTRLWAALQEASGGTWAGCIYDVNRIVAVLRAGMKALEKEGN
jgi:hypothetical protein